MPIYLNTGEICENIFHNDTLQFGVPRIASSFYFWNGSICILIDVGTSDNVNTIIKTLKKNNVPLSKVKGIIPSHYHFDHGGGSLKLWRKMVEINPDFKIIVPQDMHDNLQDAVGHLEGARTTFGDFVGTMDSVPEEAYQIVKKDVDLPIDLKDDWKIRLISTPGHTADHCSPAILKNGKYHFIFIGEASGTLFNSSKIVSLPTCMPPNFKNEDYMKSLSKLTELKPKNVGFGHFGGIRGERDGQIFLREHKKYMEEFRSEINRLYSENPSTRYVLENMGEKLWESRIDPYYSSTPLSVNFFKNLRLALTYGMMIDLGFRQPKYEKKQ